MFTPTPFPVIELSGAPRQRGRIHGESLRHLVHEAIETWRYFIHHTQPPVEESVAGLVHHSGFLEAARRYTPGLVEEVQGIAEGANQPFDMIFALQLMDEGGWYRRMEEKADFERCTSLGCSRLGDQPAILAQNLDWTNVFKGLEVIFHLKDEQQGIEALIPSIPGVLGTCGLNNRGIGVCTNALWRWLNNSPHGLGVNFFVRALLEKTTLAEAVAFLQDTPHASGENYLLSDFDHVVDYECSPRQVHQFIPSAGSPVVYHTNHPLVNDDLARSPDEAAPCERLRYLEFRMNGTEKRFTLESAKAILRSHYGPICRHQTYSGISGETEISVIYVLNNPPELWITKGPPCQSEYQRFTF